MRGLLYLFITVAAVISLSSDPALANIHESNLIRVQRVEEAKAYCVQIFSVLANLFEPTHRTSMGTGFIFELTPEEGFVFTNRHVVKRGDLDAQRVVLQFPVLKGVSGKILADVVFQSELYDSAVLRFDPRKLGAARNLLRVASLPTEHEFAELSRQGRGIMSFGYPRMGNQISSFGEISGLNQEFFGSKIAIQIGAAVDHGSSGGPVIDLESGKVIGITSGKRNELSGFGFALPINALVRDWNEFLKDPDYGARSFPFFLTSKVPTSVLTASGLASLIQKVIPNYFDEFESIFVVREVGAENPLRVGDLIFKVGNEVAGDQPDILLRQAYQTRSSSVPFTIIRHSQVMIVDVPVRNLKSVKQKHKEEFVLFSGMVLQDLLPEESEYANFGKPGVLLTQVLANSPASSSFRNFHKAIITDLHTTTKSAEIKNLHDVKEFLKGIPKGQLIGVGYRNQEVENNSPKFHSPDLPVIENFRNLTAVTLDDVVTSDELSLDRFRNEFDFTGFLLERRDWRKRIGARACAQTIVASTATSSHSRLKLPWK